MSEPSAPEPIHEAPTTPHDQPAAESDSESDALAVANRLRPVLLRLHRYLRSGR